MRRYSILAVLAISFFLAAPAVAGMKTLDDRQLDMVTAGSTGNNRVVNASEGRVIGKFGVADNSVNIDESVHVLTIRDSHVEIKSLITTVGDTNTTITGLNALVGIDRAPGSPSGSNSNLGNARSINQTNIIGRF